jgi:hypothetical protein
LSSDRFAIGVTISLFEKISFNSIDSESFEYLKLRGDLEEILITKVALNCIFYLHEGFQIFIIFLAIFPEPKTGIRVC